LEHGANVVVHDPYADESFGAKKAMNISEALINAECIVITTDHQVFKELEFSKIRSLMTDNAVVIDGRQLVDHSKLEGLNFFYAGVGRKLQKKLQ